MRPGVFHRPLWLVLAAVLAASSAWLYPQRIVGYQIANELAHGLPRGNLSDLYPRWLGARELLLHGRNPYSPPVTREIQQGFYGRAIDPATPGDPRDQEGFVYPLYVIFYLAPIIHFPFEIVRRVSFWVLLGLTVATVPLWLGMLRWRLPLWGRATAVILTIGSLPVIQGLKLQQMTLLVLALLAVAMVLFVSKRPLAAGFMLALATIKPQLVWLLLIWLIIWMMADWRHRYHWAVSFLLTMTVLLAASEWYLSDWIPRFFQAVHEYRTYTEAASVFDRMVPAPWSLFLRLLTAAAVVHVCWKNRKYAEETHEFAATVSLMLVVTIIITVVSKYAVYNQTMLLPALLLIIRQRRQIWSGNLASRMMLSLIGVFLVWPWVASILLAGLSFVLPVEIVERAWTVPSWTVLPLSLSVAGMVLMMTYQKTFTAPPKSGTS
jgi:hypothetical protein